MFGVNVLLREQHMILPGWNEKEDRRTDHCYHLERIFYLKQYQRHRGLHKYDFTDVSYICLQDILGDGKN